MNKRIIVIGRNYCNIITTARALGEAGYDVEVLKIFKTKPSALKFLRTMKPDAYSKYVKKYSELVLNNDKSVLIDYLCKNASDEKTLLIPVDDYTCTAIDEALDILSEHYIAPNINNISGEIVRLMDKNEQKNIAKSFDLPMLSGCVIKSNNGDFEVPIGVKYPCFVKPNVSVNSTKSKMAKCENESELNALLSKYASAGDFEMLVEEFADIINEYSILGVSTGDSAVSSGVFRVIEGGNHDRKGVAIIGEMIPNDGFGEIIEKCNAFVKSLGYCGMFDIDLIETVDGSIYFVELNFRAGASTYALNSVGINLYGAFADYVLNGKQIQIDKKVNENKIFVSEKVLMEEYARGDASASKVKKYMKMADVFFVKNDDDMKPYKYFKKYYLPSFLLRLVYKVK